MWNPSQHTPYCAILFKNDLISTFLYDGIIILQPSQAAKKLADQSSSLRLLTLFHHTLWLLYSSIPAVGKGDRKTGSPSFPQNQTNCGDKSTIVLIVRQRLHHSHFAFGSQLRLIYPLYITVMVMTVCGDHWLHTAGCVSLPVTEYLIAAVMYPHYAPISWPSHPLCCYSLGETGISGLLVLSAAPAPTIPFPYFPSPHPHHLHAKWSAESCWPLSMAADQWLTKLRRLYYESPPWRLYVWWDVKWALKKWTHVVPFFC